ncbi:cytochrome P450 [Gyrodon lividus]|nr:cytochrome P450 [Gyrodon lividus]
MALDGVALIVCGVLAITFTFIVSRLQLQRSRNVSGLPYPPGPKPLPFLGNILHLNTAEPWLSYTEWSKTYGEILYLRLLGLNFIVLSSEKVARALLDQRSMIYSERPQMPTHKMFGIEFNTVSLSYGNEWRLHRKMLHHVMRPDSVPKYYETYMRKTHNLLTNLLDTPGQFERHLKTFVGSIILSLAYGYETSSTDDPLFDAVEQLIAMLAKALSPERAAVLLAFPFIRHLPPWFPGSSLKRDAIVCRDLASKVLNVPFDLVKENMRKGCASPSMVSECISQIDRNAGEEQRQRLEHAIKGSAATLFLAGSETNSSLLHAFILAMVLYPEVQAKAHAEIDSVVGPSRLPSCKDRPLLPYVNKILRELLRWNPVVPLGIPHATSNSDIYNGFFIPKGAYVIVNVWAMSRDSDKYADLEDFKPERHLVADNTATVPLPTQDPVFGMGRRICPGRFVSDAFIFAAIVSILAMFRITKAKDSEGHEIPVEQKFTTGISIHPISFPCVFVCRSKEREQLLRAGINS